MPYLLCLLMMSLLTGCKTVDVLIPAKYSLIDSKEIVVHELKGSYGAHISHAVLTNLQKHLPQLVYYTNTPEGWHASLVHLKGSVDHFSVGKGRIHWGDFNEEAHEQLGTVTRHIELQVLIQLENEQHQILWSQIFSKQYDQANDFSLHTDEAYRALDGGSDILEGNVLSGISDLMKQHEWEQDALSALPSEEETRHEILLEVSQDIAQSFYDRTEQHLEFK